MKMKIGTLLAVTLATTALASPRPAAKPRPVAAKRAPAAKPAPTPTRPGKPTAVPVKAAPMQPRTLPSGAPACGNVQSKGPRRPCVTESK